jgi:hypothetical protein
VVGAGEAEGLSALSGGDGILSPTLGFMALHQLSYSPMLVGGYLSSVSVRMAVG